MSPTKTINLKAIAATIIIALLAAMVVWKVINSNPADNPGEWWGKIMRDFRNNLPPAEKAIEDGNGIEDTPDPNYDPEKESKDKDSKEN